MTVYYFDIWPIRIHIYLPCYPTNNLALSTMYHMPAFFFLADYILRFYLADKKCVHFWSPMAQIDFVTIIPVLFSLFPGEVSA